MNKYIVRLLFIAISFSCSNSFCMVVPSSQAKEEMFGLTPVSKKELMGSITKSNKNDFSALLNKAYPSSESNEENSINERSHLLNEKRFSSSSLAKVPVGKQLEVLQESAVSRKEALEGAYKKFPTCSFVAMNSLFALSIGGFGALFLYIGSPDSGNNEDTRKEMNIAGGAFVGAGGLTELVGVPAIFYSKYSLAKSIARNKEIIEEIKSKKEELVEAGLLK